MLLIKNVVTLDGFNCHIQIENGLITKVSEDFDPGFSGEVLEGNGMVVTTPFWNMHTHAGMTLLRGHGEGHSLMNWLEKYIWPAEANLTEELVYHGTKLACLEMIKSGTLGFMDMYWHPRGAVKAVDEMGMRAVICPVVFDNFDEDTSKACRERVVKELKEITDHKNKKITAGVAPHAIYTVSAELLQWSYNLTDGKLPYHIHLSESEFEVNSSVENHGVRPVEYLEGLGVLGQNTFAAHSCWLNKEEMNTYGRLGVKAVTCPVSNLKLAGGKICPVVDLEESGVDVFIGTDGCASNNNLDMFEEMKFTALLQKHAKVDPTVLSSADVLAMASEKAASSLGLDYGIEVGCVADLILLDTKVAAGTPCLDLKSNLVYALNGSIVNTAICGGQVLMQNCIVEAENEIIAQAEAAAKEILNIKQ